jgi:hypothetical protein
LPSTVYFNLIFDRAWNCRASLQIQAQIKKIIQLIEKAEIVLEMLDREMLEAGPDAGKAMEIFKRKEAIENRKAALEREWESLENENQKLMTRSAK